MKSPSTSVRTSGFTLIEVLVTLALLTAVMGLGMLGTLRPLQSAGITGERDLVVSLLSRARSRAMGNDGDVPHGFCYDASGVYEVFKAPYTSDAKEEYRTKSASVSVSGVPACGSGQEIIFAQLSGTTSPAEIDLSQGDASTSIQINSEGTILW